MFRSRNRKPSRRGGHAQGYRSDATPADGVSRRSETAEEARRRRRTRRRLATILLGGLFVAGTAAALFAERGYLDVKRSRDELEVQQRRLREQVERVRLLRRQVALLESDPSAMERLAREELGLVRDGEVIFLLPDPAADADEPGEPAIGGAP